MKSIYSENRDIFVLDINIDNHLILTDTPRYVRTNTLIKYF